MTNLFNAIFGGGTTNSNTQSTTTQGSSSAQDAQSNTDAQATNNAFSTNTAGSQNTSAASSVASNLNPFTSLLTNNLLGAAGTFGRGVPTYSGPLAAGATGNESGLLAALMQMQAQGGGVGGTNNYLQSVLSGSFLPGQGGGNPFLADAITAAQRPTMNNLETTLSRSLPGYFTANGHMISPNNNGNGGSSAFDTAAGIATRGAAQTMGDIAASMSSKAYGDERTNQQQAVQLSHQEVQNTVQNLQAQSLPRMIQELGIERGLSLFQGNITNILQLLQSLGGIAQPVIGNNSQSASQGTSQASGQSTSTGQSTNTVRSNSEANASSFGNSNSIGSSSGNTTPGILPDITNAFKAVFPMGA